MAGAGGLGWPDPAVLGGWNALQEARAWVGVPDNVWEVLLRQTGMYDSALGIGVQTARIRDFAAIPPVPLVKCVHDDVSGPRGNGNIVQTPLIPAVAAVGQPGQPGHVAAVPEVPAVMRNLSLVEAAQLITLWRICRRRVQADDSDPVPAYEAWTAAQAQAQAVADAIQAGLAPPVPVGLAAPAPAGPPGGGAASGAPAAPGGRKLLMQEIVDQSDTSEIIGLDAAKIAAFRDRFRQVSGGIDPHPDVAATDEQLYCLAFRVANGGTLYADFAIWTPTGSGSGRC